MKINPVTTPRDLDDFIEFPFHLYRNDPLFVPLLKRELRDQFSQKNPFFRHADVRFFLVRDGKEVCGRICSIFNQRHLDFHHDAVGFFGFFECVDDQAAASLLLDTAAGELRRRGLGRMRGPMNFSTNEECGFLVDGEPTPPTLMMPYNPHYYNRLMTAAGLTKAKDLYAYTYAVGTALPDKVLRVAAIGEKRGIIVRPVDKGAFDREMKAFQEVYNAAWEENWGFIPLTDEELLYLGNRLKQIVVPSLTLIAEHKGIPVGFLGLVPDFNQVLKRMGGRLNPWTIVKALYYARRIQRLRLLLLGIRREYRTKGVDALLFREGFKGILSGGYRQLEFSWILEDNLPVQRIIDMVGGTRSKTYRIYERTI